MRSAGAGSQVMPGPAEQLRQRLPYETLAFAGRWHEKQPTRRRSRGLPLESEWRGLRAHERKALSEEIWRMGQWLSILR